MTNATPRDAWPEIAARYERWEITGPGWTPSPAGGSFVPFAKPKRA
jgi:hypothetical protein